MEIKPYSKNAKKHPKKQVEQVAASIKEFGMNQPIVVDKQGVIIVGHGRYEALKLLGWEIKPEWVKVVDLTEEQAKAYRLADNKLNESEWDMTLVIEELKNLSEPMLDLTGFDKDLIIEPDEADDLIPDIPEEPQTVLGDLYELGNHRVLCGSATDIVNIEKVTQGNVDLVFTDPPYGISVVKGSKVGADFGIAKKGEYSEVIGDDTLEVAQDFYNACVSLGFKRYIIWGGNYFMKFLPISTGWFIWDKRGDTGIKNTFADGEMAWTNIQKQVRIYKQLWNGMIREGEKGKRVHPTQKPIMTLEKMIGDFTDEGSTIFDGFLGSGSTLIASEKTGRICYGMELDPRYVDVIVQRYVDFTGNATIKKNGQEIIWQQKKQENQ